MNTTPQTNRRRGNVARLPQALRNKINTMPDDGHTYKDIIEELQKSTSPPLPYPLTVDNISNWFDGGYQDYLRDLAWHERMTVNADRFMDLAQSNDDPTTITTGGLHAAVIQVCQLMDQLFNPKSGEVDPDKHVRVTNALSRLTRSIIRLQLHREHLAKAKAADPENPEAQQETRRKLVAKIDEVFGLRRRSTEERVKQAFPLPGDQPSEPFPTESGL